MTVFIAAPGTETLPVRMFLYIQDNIDPLVTSVVGLRDRDHGGRADRARPVLRSRAAALRTRHQRAVEEKDMQRESEIATGRDQRRGRLGFALLRYGG